MSPVADQQPGRRPSLRSPASLTLAIVTVLAAIIVVSAAVGADRGRPDTLALRSRSQGERAIGSLDDAAAMDRRVVVASRPRPGSPIRPGDQTTPFVDLPASEMPRVIVSPSGVAMPILDTRADGWMVSSACQTVLHLDGAAGTPVGRAHVVLDPGHGGVEPGAVSPGGLLEKDLNLTVAREAARLLTNAGATVILTRDGDHTMTAAARGLVATAIGPALFVSIHHNGGAEAGDGGPGTIVFTKGGSAESTRFGGLFHQTLSSLLDEAAATAEASHQAWIDEVDSYDQARLDHHRSVAERDKALVANGQVPPEATTTIPEPTTVRSGAPRVPTPVETVTTTTIPATAPTPIPVPETLAPPPVPPGEAVLPLRWAGSGNAGVRAWVRPDGQDYLAALRHSGPSPAVLVEFLYLTNPAEEALLASEDFLAAEAAALADAITRHLAGETGGSGFVADQTADQPIGGGGGRDSCVEPILD